MPSLLPAESLPFFDEPPAFLVAICYLSFLAAVFFGNKTGVSFLDISTGEFLIDEGSLNFIRKQINSFTPSEIIYSKSETNSIQEKISGDFYIYPIDDWIFEKQYCFEKLN